jgi:hypothetical protein
MEQKGGRKDESIKRRLVEKLVAEFDRVDPKPRETLKKKIRRTR